MLEIAFTPPGLWVTLAVVVVLAVLIFWKREPIRRWLRRFRVKEVQVGPVTIEIEPSQPKTPSPLHTPPAVSPKPLALSDRKPSPSPSSVPAHHPSLTLQEDPNFRQLCYFARRNQCRFFIGSGVSAEAGMPGTQALQNLLRAELSEMGITVPPDMPLPELATAMEKTGGRPHLIGLLQRAFDEALRQRPWEKGAYPWIPLLPQKLVEVVFTTNWDDLLKRAFEAAGKSVREIRHPRDLPLIPQSEYAIVKVHRDFQSPEGPVITEADYAIAQNNILQGTAGTLWGYLAAQLAQYHFVFVGYSLGDPTLALIRRAVELRTASIGEKRHFLVAPLSPEEAQAVQKWAGVYTVTSPSCQFFQGLIQELGEEKNERRAD